MKLHNLVWLAVFPLVATASAACADTETHGTLTVESHGGVAKVEPAAGPSTGKPLAESGIRVLDEEDVKAYRQAFRDARAGRMPSLKSVDDKVLWPMVKGEYLLHKKGATFNELNGWLKENNELSLAGAVYDAAQDRRARPREHCSWHTVKVRWKSDHKLHRVKRKRCHTTGHWGPAPVVPLVMQQREEAQQAREAARAAARAKLSDEAKKVLNADWRARSRGHFDDALKVLLAPGARPAIGNVAWQSELVRIADGYHADRDWKGTLKAAKEAVSVDGPNRDEGLWLAGYAAYRLGKVEDAAKYWQTLVNEEPVKSQHYARAAWWGARAFTELNEDHKARMLLQAGTRDPLSFYGQLCSARLGHVSALDWAKPDVDSKDWASLLKVPAARRGIALAQIGETDLSQRELKLADPDLPYRATRALAGVGLALDLPATSMRAAKQLAEQGEIIAAALYPTPTMWKPDEGWAFDRMLMLGIMRQESAFQPGIGSRVGAQGLMQLMPSTARFIAGISNKPRPDHGDLHDPATNLGLAQDYLRYLSSKLDGNLLLVVAAYNGGIGNVQRWLNNGITPGHDPVLWLESIPFDETRDYVEKVFANYWLYQQHNGVKPWSLRTLAEGFWPMRWSSTKTSGNES